MKVTLDEKKMFQFADAEDTLREAAAMFIVKGQSSRGITLARLADLCKEIGVVAKQPEDAKLR